MKILVAYFSRSGYTRRVAESLAHTLGARILRIDEFGSRDGPLGYLRSAFEALRGAGGRIRPLPLDVGQFDLVVVGTPVWASHMSSPVRAFVRQYGAKFKQVALFCTLGGSGGEKTLDEIAHLLDRVPLATLAITDHEIDDGSAGAKLKQFAQALRTRKVP